MCSRGADLERRGRGRAAVAEVAAGYRSSCSARSSSRGADPTMRRNHGQRAAPECSALPHRRASATTLRSLEAAQLVAREIDLDRERRRCPPCCDGFITANCNAARASRTRCPRHASVTPSVTRYVPSSNGTRANSKTISPGPSAGGTSTPRSGCSCRRGGCRSRRGSRSRTMTSVRLFGVVARRGSSSLRRAATIAAVDETRVARSRRR